MKQKSSLPIKLDKRVVFTLVVTGVISIGLTFLSFRDNNNGDLISLPTIFFKPGLHYTEENIRFTTAESNLSAGRFKWYFGDSLTETEDGNTVFHSFKKPGLIMIRLIVDGKYSKDTAIKIIQHLPGLVAKVSGPPYVYVGQRVVFRDSTPSASKWEWRFGETNTIDATVPNPTYAFKTTGNKRVILIVNNEIKGELEVFVQQKEIERSTDYVKRDQKNMWAVSGPTTEELNHQTIADKSKVNETKVDIAAPKEETIVLPPPPPPPPISVFMLEKKLRMVVEGEMHASDFKADLCNTNPDILYNSKPITLGELCIKLRDIKKSKRIKKMLVTRQIDPATNCVKSITVDIDKKWPSI